jgi:hypothetical protein
MNALVRGVGALALAGAVLTPAVEAQTSCVQRNTPTIIQPGDPRWLLDLNTYPDDLNNATGAITATNPRSGTGSLELTTSGSLFDWAFFQRTAGVAGAWGLLSEVNCLAFEWYREPYLLAGNPDPSLLAETWLEQTPALRVMVRDLVDNTWLISHLVWEGWYNSPGVLSPTSNGTWNYEDLTEQLFWRHFDGGLTYTNSGCFNGSFIGSSALQTFSLSGWVQNCYSPNAQVFGLMVGVGSMWPGEYQGWVDNVQLAFEGQDGFTLEDNFDFAGPGTAVPEPATMALIATGLLGLAAAGAYKRRRNPDA